MPVSEYQVNLPVFEGPMDLLLHLVQKNRIDIHDIPIHQITDQYMDYLSRAQEFNLDLGSSFFTMASTLLLIKSKMLLPKARQETEEDEEDPRIELERSLIEFKRMKEMKASIENLMNEESQYRSHIPMDVPSGAFKGKISLRKLSSAFFSLYNALEEEKGAVLEGEEISLDDKIKEWQNLIHVKGKLPVVSFFRRQKTRMALAVSFMALLELIRLDKVILKDSAKGIVVMLRGGIPCNG